MLSPQKRVAYAVLVAFVAAALLMCGPVLAPGVRMPLEATAIRPAAAEPELGGGEAANDTATAPGPPAQGMGTPAQLETDTPHFTDIGPGDWFYDKAIALVSSGVIGGYPDASFRPAQQATRAEVASFLARARGLTPQGGESFYDVRGADWFYGPVVAVYEAGLMNGTAPDRFSPGTALTREQAAAIVVRAAGLTGIGDASEQGRWLQGFKDRRSIGSWARPYVAAAVKYGLMVGYTNREFRPVSAVSRAEASSLIWSMQYGVATPRATYPAYVVPYPWRPGITSPQANQVIYTGSHTVTAKIDPESTLQELWVNGSLVETRRTSGASSVSFTLKAPRQVYYIGVISRNTSGYAYSGTLTVYHFSAPESYERLIVVDKGEFQLYWIVDGKVKKIYPIAIGKDGTPTPIAKWIVGQKHIEDPNGVFGPRRLRLYIYKNGTYNYTGYGIHGTNEPWAIGTQASHGCIRLRNADILELWPQVDIGDHVLTQN